jgi:hypothetical protein
MTAARLAPDALSRNRRIDDSSFAMVRDRWLKTIRFLINTGTFDRQTPASSVMSRGERAPLLQERFSDDGESRTVRA